uniref:Uncharacterized protein n=1 Tax=Fagus sylvatica TaxID=28930 RepID=A0A2N9JBM4_FAGSY
MQACQTSTAMNKARSHFEDQGGSGKAIKGGIPEHSDLFGLGSQYSPGPEEGRKTTNAVFSFMDRFSGYNQIKMAEEDKSKTAFVTHWGTFVYDVMPFGLKNAGATYQRAMVTLFHDMIHHEIEVYVDDMIAKSRTTQDHLTDLRKLFQRLKKYQLRLNPNKCAFGVTSRENYWASLSAAGESRLILQRFKLYEACPHQRTEKEIRSFLGRINYIARFIAQLTATCEPLFKLLRKDVKIKWTEDCQKAFDKIKEYLLNPPILVPPTPGRPLILYLTVQEASMGCMLGQQDETGRKEQAIYYLSKKFTEPETPLLATRGLTCTNNMTEYEACIVGLQAALEFGAYELEVFGDSLLIVSQTNGEWQARDPKLIPYQRIETRDIPAYCVCVEECMNVEAEIDNKPWYYDIKRFIQDREYPPRATENEKKYVRKEWLFQFFLKWRDVCTNGLMTPPSYVMCRCRGSQSIDSRNAYGVDGNPCQWTLPRPEKYESWLLLVDNGEGLHQTCLDVPQMPDVSELQECTSPISPHYGLAMAFLGLGEWIYANSSRSNTTNSAPYRPKMNGAVEAANKNVKKILSKMTETYKDWHEHLPYALCAYRTSVRTSVGATPLFPGIRDGSSTASRSGDPFFENPVTNSAGRGRMGPSTPGDLVLKKRNTALSDSGGKFAPSYEGPYMVKKAFLGGAIILADMDGEEFRSPINSDSVIKYHV